jgi:hypothetical protein
VHIDSYLGGTRGGGYKGNPGLLDMQERYLEWVGRIYLKQYSMSSVYPTAYQ